MSKIRKYRIVLKNVCDKMDIEAEVEDDLGDVEIVEYWTEQTINFQSRVHPGDIMPHTLHVIALTYKEKEPE